MNEVRRVTGSSDIPLTKEGEQQASNMANKYSFPFDHVMSSPEQRSVETAKHFGQPHIINGLDAWYRGAHEGKPADSVKGAMKYLITHPNKKPSGVSPVSGKPGESYGDFLKHLMSTMRVIAHHHNPEDRTLLVTSGGNMQALDELAKEGFPSKPNMQRLHKIASTPYWTAKGQLFEVTDNGLKKVSDNKDPGIYVIEHTATAFNPPGAPNRP